MPERHPVRRGLTIKLNEGQRAEPMVAKFRDHLLLEYTLGMFYLHSSPVSNNSEDSGRTDLTPHTVGGRSAGKDGIL